MRVPARWIVAAAGLALLGGVASSAASCTLDVLGTGPAAGEGGAGGSGGSGAGQGGGGAAHAGGGEGEGEGGAGGDGDALVLCGNGVLDATEICDDGNAVPGDGCTGCAVDDGFACSTPPSICVPLPPLVAVTEPSLNLAIKDDESYDGTLASMDCVPLQLAAPAETRVHRVELEMGLEHNQLGNLVIKLASPSSKVTAVMSRPGVDDPVDAAFDSTEEDDSNLRPNHPILFAEGEAVSAEDMGADLSAGEVVCEEDQICAFAPAPDSGEPFSSLLNDPPAGTWQVCVADGESGNSGKLRSAKLSVWAW